METPRLHLDYVLTRQHGTRDVLHTRVMPSADCYTDHRLVRCKVVFTFKSPPRGKGYQTKKLQVLRFRYPRVKNNMQVMLEERLHCVTAAEPEEQWKQIKTILQETTAEVVGLSTRKHRDWFHEVDRKIQESLEKERSCHSFEGTGVWRVVWFCCVGIRTTNSEDRWNTSHVCRCEAISVRRGNHSHD